MTGLFPFLLITLQSVKAINTHIGRKELLQPDRKLPCDCEPQPHGLMVGQEAVCVLTESWGPHVAASTPSTTANGQFQQPQSGLVPEQGPTLRDKVPDGPPRAGDPDQRLPPGEGTLQMAVVENTDVKDKAGLNWRWELPLIFGH